MSTSLALLLLALAPGQYFAVQVEQDGRNLPIRDGRVYLAKKPFSLVLELREPQLVLVHASLGSKTIDAVRAGKPLDSIPGLQGTGAAEGEGNPERGLFLLPDGFNAWYYHDAAHHRFDEPCRRKASTLVCRRTIEKLWLEGGKTVPVAEVDGQALHLVFLRTKWKADYSSQDVLQLTSLSLIFEPKNKS
ncbi:MAG: hypothetical protein JXR96_21410 [Deltaproteobacteria bacterium]|nr:hypothetical protein [Deltaproteobacteria bacterium]